MASGNKMEAEPSVPQYRQHPNLPESVVSFTSGFLSGFSKHRNSCDADASVQGSTMIEEEYKFVEVSHPAQVLSGLNHLRQSQTFCDVTLCVDEHEFHCHRIVLASYSPYFNAMFTGNLAESTQERVTLNGIEAPVIDLLINYAYTSEIMINRQNVQSLLSAANLLEILPVKEACGLYLERNMDAANCIGMHCFAETHACSELQEKSKKYILNKFTCVSIQEEFLQLSQSRLVEFLCDDELNVDSEGRVYESVIRWLNYDIPGRRDNFHNVLEQVRLPLMSAYFLSDIVEKHEVVCQSEACRALMDEAKTYVLQQDRHPELQSPRTKLRKPQRCAEVIICGGGEEDKAKVRATIQRFVTIYGRKMLRNCTTLCTGDNHIYLAGGRFPDDSASRSFWRFDQNLDTWMEMASMNIARSDLGLAMLDGHVYAIGGWNGSSRLDSVERYDPILNTWTFLPRMKIALNSPAVVALKGHLYVAGGDWKDRHWAVTDLVQCYNPRIDAWIEKPTMQFARCGSAACVLNGLIYIIGGYANHETTNKVECYNVDTDEWIQKAPMVKRRYRPGVAVIGNRIYVFGGAQTRCGSDSRCHKTIECYDPQTDVWEIVGEILIRKDINNA